MPSGQTNGSALFPRLHETNTSQRTGIWYRPASLFSQYLLARRLTLSSTTGSNVVLGRVVNVGLVGLRVVVVVVVVVFVVGLLVVVVFVIVVLGIVVGLLVVVVVVIVVGLGRLVVVGSLVVGLTGAAVVVRFSRLASANPFK